MPIDPDSTVATKPGCAGQVARIERVTQAALQQELGTGAPIGPAAMFRALRSQTEALGYKPDWAVQLLSELVGLVDVWKA